MNYTFYDPLTGEIQGTGGGSGIDVLSYGNRSYVEGTYDSGKFYLDLDTLQPVAKPRDPSGPYTKYKFDWTAKTWTIDLDQTAELVRTFRTQLLSAIDRVNAVWYAALTQEQQQELVTYRQELLDITQQSGFPSSVVWPSKPAWL
jgi:hypothetical protein